MGEKSQGQGSERGRSDEARDPDRVVDPVTGEKEGLGPREGTEVPADGTLSEPIEGDDDAADDTPSA
jgi:hypothetical protein